MTIKTDQFCTIKFHSDFIT